MASLKQNLIVRPSSPGPAPKGRSGQWRAALSSLSHGNGARRVAVTAAGVWIKTQMPAPAGPSAYPPSLD